MKQMYNLTLSNHITRIQIRTLLLSVLALLVLSGCATGTAVKKADDIRDDGKSNIVVITYDLKLHSTDRYPTYNTVGLSFTCPESSKLSRSSCFRISAGFLGLKDVDGYLLNAF